MNCWESSCCEVLCGGYCPFSPKQIDLSKKIPTFQQITLVNITQMRNSKILQSFFIILVFLIAAFGKRLLGGMVDITIDSPLLALLYAYAWWIIPVVVIVGLLFGFKNVLKELCLDKGFLTGLGFGLVVAAPMLISSAFIGTIDGELDLLTLLKKTLLAGFMEEFLFRGFLFGILFRKMGWGFIPASVLGATIFALSHLYQGSGVNELMGIFLVTFIASAWFSWLFIEWKENLWIAIFLHGFMNLSWTLFEVIDNALGEAVPNIFRIITIVISVVATILYSLKKDKFRIHGKNLFVNKELGQTG